MSGEGAGVWITSCVGARGFIIMGLREMGGQVARFNSIIIIQALTASTCFPKQVTGCGGRLALRGSI